MADSTAATATAKDKFLALFTTTAGLVKAANIIGPVIEAVIAEVKGEGSVMGTIVAGEEAVTGIVGVAKSE